jgi:hypothetical protein
MSDATKKCSRCGFECPLAEANLHFKYTGRYWKTPDELKHDLMISYFYNLCQHGCSQIKQRESYQKHKEKRRQEKRDAYKANPETFKRRRSQYYYENREKINEVRRVMVKQEDPLLREERLAKERLRQQKRRDSLNNSPDRAAYIELRRTTIKLEKIDPVGYGIRKKMQRWEKSASQRGVEWGVSYEQLRALWDSQHGRCAYTGLPLSFEANHPQIISLDRIDSDRGYTETNIAFCCSIINLMKLDNSVHQLLEYATLITKTLPAFIKRLKPSDDAKDGSDDEAAA